MTRPSPTSGIRLKPTLTRHEHEGTTAEDWYHILPRSGQPVETRTFRKNPVLGRSGVAGSEPSPSRSAQDGVGSLSHGTLVLSSVF